MAASASASVITVRQDGTGNYLTLGEAFTASQPDDTILVGPGTYTEADLLESPHSLIILSTDGPLSTTLDRALLFQGRSQNSIVDGFTLSNSDTHPVRAMWDALLTIRNCVFEGNPGGTLLVAYGATAVVEDTRFRDNTRGIYATEFIDNDTQLSLVRCAFDGNFGVSVRSSGATVSIIDCRFIDNTGDHGTSAIEIWGGFFNIRGGLFADNDPWPTRGGTVELFSTTGSIENCTFYRNQSECGADVLVANTQNVAVNHNIFYGHALGAAISMDNATTSRDCNLFFRNDSGPIEGGALTVRETIADPVFCDAPGGNFTVSALGPAAPANNACARLIGAFGAACSISPPPPPPQRPGVITARKFGGGDYPTIAAALAAATPGDTVLVGPGTYRGRLDVRVPVVLISEDGPETTHIGPSVCSSQVTFLAGPCQLQGFSLNGKKAITVAGKQLVVKDCTFVYGIEAVLAVGDGANVLLDNCRFTNSVGKSGGVTAVSAEDGAHVTMSRCEVRGNRVDESNGRTVRAINARVDILDCLFANNSGNPATASTIDFTDATGSIKSTTLYSNASGGSIITIRRSPGVTIEHSILASNTAAAAIEYVATTPSLRTCNLFWDNTGPDISGDSLQPDEVVADPLFCDVEGDDFRVSELSPAAPDHSTCGQLIGAFGTGCSTEPPPPPPPGVPIILGIDDVPDDQGRQVRIHWSGVDHVETSPDVTSYAVYRSDGAPGEANWNHLLTQPASGDSLYSATVTTLCDATPQDPCPSPFMVSALTTDTLKHFDSLPDTGYSIDNLPPGPPEDLSADLVSPGIQLDWTAPDAPDVAGYRVYRGDMPDFTQDVSSLLSETPDTEWYDSSGDASHYYKVTAMDDGGNESEPAEASTEARAEVVEAFSLGQNEPNPFNPSTLIPYSVGPGGGRVTVRVYDVGGRLVATLVDEAQSSGPKITQWDGSDRRGGTAASGVYFYRLTAPGFEQTRKMVLLR